MMDPSLLHLKKRTSFFLQLPKWTKEDAIFLLAGIDPVFLKPDPNSLRYRLPPEIQGALDVVETFTKAHESVGHLAFPICPAKLLARVAFYNNDLEMYESYMGNPESFYTDPEDFDFTQGEEAKEEATGISGSEDWQAPSFPHFHRYHPGKFLIDFLWSQLQEPDDSGDFNFSRRLWEEFGEEINHLRDVSRPAAKQSSIPPANEESGDSSEPLHSSKATSLYNILGALLSVIDGTNPSDKFKKHPDFTSQAKLIEHLEDVYEGVRGLKKRTLERHLAKAKNQLVESQTSPPKPTARRKE